MTDDDPIQRQGLRDRFWERVPLKNLAPKEWEALCDGCGKCCLNKLEDPETQEVAFTRVACRLLDGESCRCGQYEIRKQFVPDCVVLTPENISKIAYWMPGTCAYRLLYEGKQLYDWHPLISGTAQSVHDAGVSVRGWTVPEFEVPEEEWEDHIIEDPALMYFASDNAGPVHPKVMAALDQANTGYVPSYGSDPVTTHAVQNLQDLFEAPDAGVFLVPTGTAANAILLSALAKPFQSIFCAPQAHILIDECGAVELATGGSRLVPVGLLDDKITPDALETAIEHAKGWGVHGHQPGAVSITQVTERGTLYSLDQIRAITDVAHSHDLAVHMDGARFANAVVALGCTPAEMSWKAGIDAVSFGGTKNGLMGVEAAIIFDQEKISELEYRRKRLGHLFSKGRYLGAQMAAYLSDDLWRETALAANAAAGRLSEQMQDIPGISMDFPPQANMIFARFPRAAHQRLFAAGAQYELRRGPLDQGDLTQPLPARLVCDWSTPDSNIDQFLSILRD